MAPEPKTVDDYIATFPDDRQQLLQLVRSAIHRGVPDAEEKIRYGMPAVMLGSRAAIHFAGWKNHIGMYAFARLDEPLESAIAPYRSEKDTLAFRWSEPIPFDVIQRACAAVAVRYRE
jgi:uncharacterized protein YdhG (YjbR/CyaY superfamily)